jgi:hypothetical protein
LREKQALNAIVDKQQMLNEIRRTAGQNGGHALGERAFSAATGIRRNEWYPKLWPRFSAAVKDAGLVPQEFSTEKDYNDDDLLEKYAKLAQKLRNSPTNADIRHQKSGGAEIANSDTYGARFGSKQKLVSRLAEYCGVRSQFADVHDLCTRYLSKSSDRASVEVLPDVEMGYVYLFRMGKYYKIGATSDLLRRGREIKTLLPEKCEVIHSLRTDDPTGIEAYWHLRFENKRREGEWFELTAKEVAAFKRRRTFM